MVLEGEIETGPQTGMAGDGGYVTEGRERDGDNGKVRKASGQEGGRKYIPLVGDVPEYGGSYEEGRVVRRIIRQKDAYPFRILQYLERVQWRPGVCAAWYVSGKH